MYCIRSFSEYRTEHGSEHLSDSCNNASVQKLFPAFSLNTEHGDGTGDRNSSDGAAGDRDCADTGADQNTNKGIVDIQNLLKKTTEV